MIFRIFDKFSLRLYRSLVRIVRLGGVDGAGSVLWRGVDGVELERFASRVYHVVLRTGRYDSGIAVFEDGFLPIHDYLALAFLDPEELIMGIMCLQADLFARLERHDNQLHIRPGIDDFAIIRVVLGDFLYIACVAFHTFDVMNYASSIHRKSLEGLRLLEYPFLPFRRASVSCGVPGNPE